MVQGNIWWATEEEAASPSVPPEDPPVDRFLPAAFRTSSRVSREQCHLQYSYSLLGARRKQYSQCNKWESIDMQTQTIQCMLNWISSD